MGQERRVIVVCVLQSLKDQPGHQEKGCPSPEGRQGRTLSAGKAPSQQAPETTGPRTTVFASLHFFHRTWFVGGLATVWQACVGVRRDASHLTSSRGISGVSTSRIPRRGFGSRSRGGFGSRGSLAGDPSPRVVFRRAAVFDGWGLSGEAARMRGSVPTVAVDAGRWSAGGERRRLQGWNGDSGAYDLQILALAA